MRPFVASVLLDGPWDTVGERLCRFFLAVWSEPGSRAPLVAMMSAATSVTNWRRELWSTYFGTASD